MASTYRNGERLWVCDACGDEPDDWQLFYEWRNADSSIGLPEPFDDLKFADICAGCYRDGMTMARRIRARRAALRCRYEDCSEGHPVALEDADENPLEPITCPTCREAMGLPAHAPAAVAFPADPFEVP